MIRNLTLLFLINLSTPLALKNSPFAKTSIGLLEGTSVKINGNEVHQFLGVPFAKAPVGSLRFQRPESLSPTPTVVRDATKFAPTCIQMRHISETINPLLNVDEQHTISEDCLYLNVYVPVTNESSLPVMVWIPGEGFDFADARQFDGSYLAAVGNVIVVTIQYRVGVFGFLKLDDYAPGNMGLWDQVEAIKWVRNNIASFGGDTEKITVFGRFSGAMSISLLLTSPHLLEEQLFERAILMSGVAVGNWVLQSNPQKKAETYLRALNCTSQTGNDCLLNLSSTQLLEKSGYEWKPTKDGTLLTKSPLVALKDGLFNKKVTEILLGATDAEGYLCYLTHWAMKSKYYQKLTANELTEKDFTSMAKADLTMIIGSNWTYDPFYHNLMLSSLNKEQLSLRHRYIDFCSHLLIHIPMRKFTKLLSTNVKVTAYTYRLKYRPTYSILPKFITASGHGDDVLLLFAHSNSSFKFASKDASVAKTMVKSFASFASEGTPNARLNHVSAFNEINNNLLLQKIESNSSSQSTISMLLICLMFIASLYSTRSVYS